MNGAAKPHNAVHHTSGSSWAQVGMEPLVAAVRAVLSSDRLVWYFAGTVDEDGECEEGWRKRGEDDLKDLDRDRAAIALERVSSGRDPCLLQGCHGNGRAPMTPGLRFVRFALIVACQSRRLLRSRFLFLSLRVNDPMPLLCNLHRSARQNRFG